MTDRVVDDCRNCPFNADAACQGVGHPSRPLPAYALAGRRRPPWCPLPVTVRKATPWTPNCT